jgi:hypothetical protein
VTLNNTVTVPAQSEMFLIGTINRELAGEDCMLEPSDYVRHRGLLVGKSVVQPETENTTVCRLVPNLSKKDIKLTKYSIAASVPIVSLAMPSTDFVVIPSS